jgi:protein tyrosine/serine phosphatase
MKIPLIAILLVGFTLISLDFEIPLPKHSVKNLHAVDRTLYRSGQPTKKGMKDLDNFGIRTVLNLRNVIDDKREIKGTKIKEIRLPMRAKNLSYQNLIDALCAIENAEKPVVVHCLHGSDRTGGIVAAYRMYNGWSKEKAIQEFLQEKYGYNSGLFPNILKLLQSINVEKLKKDVNCNS